MAVSATVAIAATMSVSAFADVAQVELKEDNTASVTVTPATAQADNAQYTVMLFKSTGTTVETIADAAPAAPTDIYYINQSGNVTDLVSDMLVKGASLPADTYVVRIGNDTGADVENVLLTVTKKAEGVELTLNYGDVNGDGKVDNGDAGIILQKYVGLVKGFTDQENRAIPETVADVNGDGKVDNGDAGIVLQKYVGLVKGFTDQNGDALTTYTYTYVAPTE